MRKAGLIPKGERKFLCTKCKIYAQDKSPRVHQKAIAPETKAERRQRAGQMGDELLELIRSKVPYYLRYEIREDVIQELIVAVLSGEVDLSELPKVIPFYARRIYRLSANRFNSVPLDTIIPGTERLTYADLLAG
jgi:hypothetical protein